MTVLISKADFLSVAGKVSNELDSTLKQIQI